jgi:hypothetical protein
MIVCSAALAVVEAWRLVKTLTSGSGGGAGFGLGFGFGFDSSLGFYSGFFVFPPAVLSVPGFPEEA